MAENNLLLDDDRMKKPSSKDGENMIIGGGIAAIIGVIMIVYSGKTYIVTRYQEIGGFSFPIQVAEKTYEAFQIPGIILGGIGIIAIILGILAYQKSIR